jgi:hypothetical protein
MSHTGAYNAEFIMLVVGLFFLPAIVQNFMKLFSWMSSRKVVDVSQSVQPTLCREQQWDMIVESAMFDAMSGNKSARDWVTKHVFSETEPQQSGISTTSREIIREAHEALKPLGYKPTELKDKIRDLCKDKIYTSADDLIQDFIRGA